MTKVALRRKAILKLLDSLISVTQRDLLEALKREGYSIHRTTLSRDLKALNVRIS